jgi:putative membrane protein
MRHPYLAPHRAGGGSFIFGIVMLIFWAAVITGLVLLVQHYLKRQNGINHTQDPIDIAKARYARGEITKDEFVQLKKDLS